MSKDDSKLITSLIQRYFLKFDEGPPIIGYSDEEIICELKKSLESGCKMEGRSLDDYPPGTYF
ncbi:MAG: hypothetical protein OEX00_05230 [Gammaproteobacteria bacterium]|nr:hypothetical protein [Gammaproteobacteria bacterium]MDH5694199.1 hypothetical protein [Gammaproteobacteria bacterium]